ncbi:MAG: ABC transporter ATP-binding protein [Cyclobacteriaceae bacterium]
MKLLETKSLSIGYEVSGSPTKVLQSNINVAINEGEIISLMGQNGVGKTTFIKTLSGILPSLEGKVYYGDQPLKQLSKQDLARRLSIVLTEKPFSQNITVLELIAIGRHPYSNWAGMLSKHDKEVIDWAITETNTNYMANRKLYELSDGQLQKVMIARALAQETALIYLDEPAAHLDLYNKIEVMMLLRKIAKNGKGILISTHDMQVSTQLSDKLWLFNFNEPPKEGTPEDLILDGTLERTLYLQGYGYDMIHGSVDMQIETKGEVALEGDDEVIFWTKQALHRHGIKVQENSLTKIICQKNHWSVLSGESSISCDSIRDLISKLPL